MAGVDQLPIVARQRLESAIGSLDEDVRLVAGGAQHALDAEHLVADRIAVPERRQHLMNRRASRARRHAPLRGLLPRARPRCGPPRRPPCPLDPAPCDGR